MRAAQAATRRIDWAFVVATGTKDAQTALGAGEARSRLAEPTTAASRGERHRVKITAASRMTGRLLLGLGSLVRLAVGIGYLANPEAMARNQLAPDIRGHPDGRMSTRGFGALHTGISLATLRAATRDECCRELAVLNLACALGDTAATLLERLDRGGWEPVVLGSVPVDLADVAWWSNALRHL